MNLHRADADADGSPGSHRVSINFIGHGTATSELPPAASTYLPKVRASLHATLYFAKVLVVFLGWRLSSYYHCANGKGKVSSKCAIFGLSFAVSACAGQVAKHSARQLSNNLATPAVSSCFLYSYPTAAGTELHKVNCEPTVSFAVF